MSDNELAPKTKKSKTWKQYKLIFHNRDIQQFQQIIDQLKKGIKEITSIDIIETIASYAIGRKVSHKNYVNDGHKYCHFYILKGENFQNYQIYKSYQHCLNQKIHFQWYNIFGFKKYQCEDCEQIHGACECDSCNKTWTIDIDSLTLPIGCCNNIISNEYWPQMRCTKTFCTDCIKQNGVECVECGTFFCSQCALSMGTWCQCDGCNKNWYCYKHDLVLHENDGCCGNCEHFELEDNEIFFHYL